jgi:hypothetical protein
METQKLWNTTYVKLINTTCVNELLYTTCVHKLYSITLCAEVVSYML